jgi:uncharacterized protein (DUF2141 family)
MFKLVSSIATAAAALALLPAAAHATPVGPFASLCASGKPAILARVSGFKAATGTVAIKLYQSGPKFLEKGAYIRKVEVPVTRTGPIDVCVPVPASGRYALSVRHEVTGDKSRADGGGFSGNPNMSLIDLALKRKPKAEQVTFSVTDSTRVVPVVLKYLQGGSLRTAG